LVGASSVSRTGPPIGLRVFASISTRYWFVWLLVIRSTRLVPAHVAVAPLPLESSETILVGWATGISSMATT
jgi:hypothetical protein